MSSRANYYEINPKAIDRLGGVNKFVTTIDEKLKALIDLRVSQINGCVYCVDLHSNQARDAHETQQRLDTLVTWHESPFFTEKERAALAWAESLTNVSQTHAPDDVYHNLSAHFSEAEIVDLTLIISLMNSWNRIAIGLRKMPEARS